MHDTQVAQLSRLRDDPQVRSVAVRDIAVVTDSVQVTVHINRTGRLTEAVIAPSGRLYVLGGTQTPADRRTSRERKEAQP